MAALIFLIVMPIGTILANYLMDKYGMSKSIKLGLCLSVIGAWVRLFIGYNIAYIIFGNFFAAVGAPFIYNAKGKVAANWFPPDSRSPVTSLISFMGTMSGVFGVLIPGLWFLGYKNETDLDY